MQPKTTPLPICTPLSNNPDSKKACQKVWKPCQQGKELSRVSMTGVEPRQVAEKGTLVKRNKVFCRFLVRFPQLLLQALFQASQRLLDRPSADK
ncbi:hypothetical protein AVEN_203745-1 [Araneus ventricosus]|uniref:Uncharacterized protein n=1 Tax=Araneus ventricosus TaxID=182803 RepID=A0A4Y2PMX4_ARAVE|nr:hypothetical protein AVEN_203745-1 [Araneus ventricosus]